MCESSRLGTGRSGPPCSKPLSAHSPLRSPLPWIPAILVPSLLLGFLGREYLQPLWAIKLATVMSWVGEAVVIFLVAIVVRRVLQHFAGKFFAKSGSCSGNRGSSCSEVQATGWEDEILSSSTRPPSSGDGSSSEHESDSPTEREPHIRVMDMTSGKMTRSNPSTPMYFDNDLASGSYLILHRPPAGWESEAGAYFEGKARLWEVRVQLRFKREVQASQLRVGTSPWERVPLSMAQVAAHRAIIKLMGPAMRGFYNSPGDEPKGRDPEDVEPPMTSICVTESDQHIATPGDEEAPGLLSASFPTFGKRKTSDRAGYRNYLRDLVIHPGEVHTFSFWGPARFVSLIDWQMSGLPMMRALSLDTLNGPPPLVLQMYILEPGQMDARGREETRHLPSRIKTICRVCGWPSAHPPPAPRLAELRAHAASKLATAAAAGTGALGEEVVPETRVVVEAGERANRSSSSSSPILHCLSAIPQRTLAAIGLESCCGLPGRSSAFVSSPWSSRPPVLLGSPTAKSVSVVAGCDPAAEG